MPMGPYANWDACIADQMKKGHDANSAAKICGKIKHETEGVEKFMENVLKLPNKNEATHE